MKLTLHVPWLQILRSLRCLRWLQFLNAESYDDMCRHIRRQASEHSEHDDGNGQHGLRDSGVPGCGGGPPGHDPAGHLRGSTAPRTPRQLPCGFRRLYMHQVWLQQEKNTAAVTLQTSAEAQF